MKFRPLSKTVVTEIRSFVVDSVSKIGLYRQTVSAPIDLAKSLDDKDFNISATEFLDIQDASVLLAISCPEPIRAIFTGLGPVVITPPVVTEIQYHTATLITESSIEAGSPISVTISDVDLEQVVSSIGAVVYNTDSGETEHVECFRQIDGTYIGTLNTVNSSVVGTNFDNSMSCVLGQTLHVIYSDPKSSAGIRENVTNVVTVLSPTETAVIETRDFVSISKPVPITIYDKDATALTIPITVRNLITGEQEILNASLIEAGKYTVSCATKVYNGISFDNADGALDVLIGHQIQIDFIDTKDINNSTSVVSKIVDIVGTVTEIGSIDVATTVTIDTDLMLTINDYDLVGQQLSVTVSNIASGEYEIVTLNETVFGSGVFKGSLPVTTQTSGANSDGALLAAVGNRLRVVYVDVGGSLTTVEKFVDVVAVEVVEDVPEVVVPDPTPVPETVEATGTIEMLINGSFFLNGTFNGTIRLVGLNEEPTRCKIILS